MTTDAAGRRVMAKVGLTADEASQLGREAELLDAARHPGVVELVGVDGSGVGSMLLTAQVEGPTLAAVGPLPLEEAAGLLSALASTLADLHELGLVHGAVCPEHVIVGPGGRPVLCGLAYGGRAGEPAGPAPAVGRAFADPARADADVLTSALTSSGSARWPGSSRPAHRRATPWPGWLRTAWPRTPKSGRRPGTWPRPCRRTSPQPGCRGV